MTALEGSGEMLLLVSHAALADRRPRRCYHHGPGAAPQPCPERLTWIRTSPARRFPNYEILDLIGGGGMGSVYRARDTRLSRIVALKFLPPELIGDQAARERFVNEARTASTFEHPHVATVFDIGQADGQELAIKYLSLTKRK